AEFKLEYFNTSSSKQIFKIISLLKELSKTNSVAIKWYFDKGDKDMQLSGERFSKLCQMPIETIQN
ncbi:MAG TPA: SiaC family regulatory phosphoprotein, partial [Bacteroidia bacterium]|nr:SiaC family regulatory phosphoprotein [Bacteroidia bacterium]